MKAKPDSSPFEDRNSEDGAFSDCLRLRELAGRQTLRQEDNRDLDAIADRLHALAVSRRIDTRYALREGDHLEYLSPQECAVILHYREADALLALLELAHNAGLEPGVGLRSEDARVAGFKIVSERWRDQDPYCRGLRLVATVARRPS